MQASKYLRSSALHEDADHSQKIAQSKDFCSLLAPTSTGMMTTSLDGTNAGFRTCYMPFRCSFVGMNRAATDGHALSLEEDSYLDHHNEKENTLLPKRVETCESGNRAGGVSFKRKFALSCSVAVIVCLNSVALGFCVHLHHRMHDQSQMMQTVLEDLSSLRQDYLALRDDNLRLHEALDSFTSQNKMSTELGDEDSTFNDNNGNTMQPPDGLLQLLRNNGLPKHVSTTFSRRIKRSDPDGDYIRSVVINYLRRMPKVHLKGINNITSASEYLDPMREYLVWQPDPESFVKRSVSLKHVHHQHNRIKAIEIEQSGVYMVYSQVVVNGTNITAGWRRDCAHQTVMLPYHDDNDRDDVRPPPPKVLLSGFLTQDAEGYYEDHSVPHPRDSSLQMGLFRLLRQSQVRVRIPDSEDCRRTLFTTDLHSSYFGLFRVA